jgi:alcohol dehydrogenase class IV
MITSYAVGSFSTQAVFSPPIVNIYSAFGSGGATPVVTKTGGDDAWRPSDYKRYQEFIKKRQRALAKQENEKIEEIKILRKQVRAAAGLEEAGVDEQEPEKLEAKEIQTLAERPVTNNLEEKINLLAKEVILLNQQYKLQAMLLQDELDIQAILSLV